MKEQCHYHNLIAISGVKCSGKNTVSEMLQYCLSVPKMLRQYWIYKLIRKLIPRKYKIVAFADPLKKMLSDLLNIKLEHFYSRDFKENCIIDISTLKTGKFPKLPDSKFNKLVKQLDSSLAESNLSLRQLLQYFGTEIMQKYFGKRVWINSTMQNSSKYTIISDLRFIEEYSVVKERDGIVIYVNRLNYEFGQHASEKEMKQLLESNQYDYIIDNNGSIIDLFNNVKKLSNDI